MRLLVTLLLISSLCACTATGKAKKLLVELPQYTAAQPLNVLWASKTGAPEDDYAKYFIARTDDRIYTIGKNGRLVVLESTTGKVLLKKSVTDSPVTGGIGLGEGLVLLGTAEGEVLAIDAITGGMKWRAVLSSEILAPPQISQGVVVVQTNDAAVFGLKATNGQRIWTHQSRVPALTLRGTSGPLLDLNQVYAAFANGQLAALELATGNPLWETTIGIPKGRTELERVVDIDAPLRIYNGIIYVVGYQSRVAAVDASNGRLLWVRDVSSYAGFTMDAQNLYLSTAEGEVWALDRLSGTVIWKQDRLNGLDLSAPVLLDNKLIVADAKGYLFWLAAGNGELLAGSTMAQLPGKYRRKNSGFTIMPEVNDNTLYLSSRNGVITAYQPAAID